MSAIYGGAIMTDLSEHRIENHVDRLEDQIDRLANLVTRLEKAADDNSDTGEDWTLSANQFAFMAQHHNEIEAAFAKDDMVALEQIASSEAFRSAFGSMGFDEACDRYETMLEGTGDKS